MERRNFIKQSFLGIGAVSSSMKVEKAQFKLNYSPKFGTFKHHAGEDLLKQISFMAEVGFKGLTDDGMRNRTPELQKKIAAQLQKHDMLMGVMAAHKYYWSEPCLPSGKENYRTEFLENIKSSVEIAKRVNGKWLVVMPGTIDGRLDMGYQTSNVIEVLKRACDILEPHGLTMVLEPVNREIPNLFLTTINQAYSICKAVDSPSCKIMNDLYHQQITEGNLLFNIEKAWDEIACFQVADNPGRMEPFTGEINFTNIFKRIHAKGYKGVIGMEHGNSIDGKAGEKAIIDAYLRADNF